MAWARHGFDPASRAAASVLERDLLAAELARSFPRAPHAEDGPRTEQPSGALIAGELARRLDDAFWLAVPVLEESAARLASSGHALSFFDSSGWMLWMSGCGAIVDRLAELDFRPGTRWLEGASAADPLAASVDRRALELVVSDRDPPSREAWHCSGAAVEARPGGGLLGTVHLTARGDAPDPAAAGAIARAVEERVRSALAVREQVIEFAFRTAAPAEPILAVDGGGRLVSASPAARRLLGLQGELPPSVREDLRAALERASAAPDAEVVLEWPGASQVTLLASPVRLEQRAVGGIVRVCGGRSPSRMAAPSAERPVARYAFEQILGRSEAIGAAVAVARMAARNELPVVLRGESGTGKELFAQAIHSDSSRAEGPFVAVNCGCIPAALLEAELFGYEPGTFTGGRREGNAGKFEKAAEGTIFLDEVTELPPQAQAALLRVLQEREVVRLGGSSPRRIDTRVIAASNASLADAVRTGRFRADLYYRLNVLPIAIPPLRERREDVPLLARAFLREAEAEVGRSGLSFSDEAIASLEAHPWPGNIRELRNIVLRCAATAATRRAGPPPGGARRESWTARRSSPRSRPRRGTSPGRRTT
jgi:sigma-54 dependent transcriptional regulator, acetoin dehydrogenase operon transcriptional activator AcoR